mmetsp:Transcript_72725/g.84458  ORF Transcript_72725/g.84458 Transcript_72725/m.84458 type:complete len:318 (-) Transcript_72725:11-964(-)
MHRTAFRHFASASRWIGKFRYGFDGAPLFGSFQETDGEDIHARSSYCKALVFASCGSRLARDWIAGYAALTLNDSEMVAIALQHDATHHDLRVFAEDLQLRMSAPVAPAPPNEASHVLPESAVPQFFPHGFRRPTLEALSPGSTADCRSKCLHSRIISSQEAETIVRCFMYDAVKAACFHRASLSQQQVEHLEIVYAQLESFMPSHEHIHVAAAAAATPTPPDEDQSSVDSISMDAQTHPSMHLSSSCHATATTTPSTATLLHLPDDHSTSIRMPSQHLVPAPASRIPFLQSLLFVVQEENMWTREKSRVIEQPGSH